MNNREFDILKQHVLNTVVPAMPGALNAITPLVYNGAVFGSEFLVYDNRKLYIVVSMVMSGDMSVSAGSAYTITYNEANAIISTHNQGMAAWDATAAAMRYTVSDLEIKANYFSRIAAQRYTYMRFVGYRITKV
jgi:hypothetical protein